MTRLFRQSDWAGITSAAFLAASSVANAHHVVIPRQIRASQLLPSYDYVVVGGGAAGLTVADRLTEDADTSVLVLEAGPWGNPDDVLWVNQLTSNTTAANASMWPGIESTPQAGLGGRTAAVSIAKQVGGGSSINAMMNMRGSAEDYNRWAELFGSDAQGGTADWSWDGILPYFKKVRSINSTVM